MRQRCSPSAKPTDLVRYYERGIRVCERWQSFETFTKDMGPRPANGTLERINNDGNYEPANCRWASMKEQARNRRGCALLTWNGQTRCEAEWSELVGIERHTIGYRIRHGWTAEEALTVPPSKANSRRKQHA